MLAYTAATVVGFLFAVWVIGFSMVSEVTVNGVNILSMTPDQVAEAMIANPAAMQTRTFAGLWGFGFWTDGRWPEIVALFGFPALSILGVRQFVRSRA